MDWIVSAGLLTMLGYLLYEETHPKKEETRTRLCDWILDGTTNKYQPGTRLVEVHITADDDGKPMVGDTSFEVFCVHLTNTAFPSKEPCILSIVSDTERSTTLNKVAEHLQTIPRKHLVSDKDIVDRFVDEFADKLLIVSGGGIQGTELENLANLNWNHSNCRRLTYSQAVHPDDPEELRQFTKHGIVLVSAEEYMPTFENPNTPKKYGCQWNFYALI
jgi:hypothetical protein